MEFNIEVVILLFFFLEIFNEIDFLIGINEELVEGMVIYLLGFDCCKMNLCFNGGICYFIEIFYVCICVLGYSGD